jgi:hypothetical protein
MTAMDVARSSHWWLSKFAARLLSLYPDASAPSAIRRAVANYDKAAHLDPEFAADVYYRKAVAAEAMRQSTRAHTSDNPEVRASTPARLQRARRELVAPKAYLSDTLQIGAMR